MRAGWRLAGAAALLVAAGAMGLPATAVGQGLAGDGRPRPPMPGSLAAKAMDAPQRLALMQRGQAALARGDAAQALDAFEQAAALQHAADIEIGVVRAQMQAGEYRHALAFAAHTAGYHREVGAGAALYAWLLQLGGQAQIARRQLALAEERLPGDGALREAAALLAGAAAEPGSLGAPVATGALPAAGARVVGNATLWPDGRHALAPLALVDAASTVWLRNGLGQGVAATLLVRDEAAGLGLLRLAEPLVPPRAALAAREPFAGSPGYVASFAADPQARPAWPQLRLGFVGRQAGDGSGRWLGIEVPPASAGAPLFDAAGGLAGIVLPVDGDGRARVASLAALRALTGLPAAAATPITPHPAPDEVYENALRSVLQLIR